ncbi:MAG: hypothetical protein P4M11_12975 [Candidatus Pacebacteria bacterium]|nr:hypothetical protein [Candidatus Paceibacterota bacterium]
MELILIKMVKSFREIGSKVDQVLSLIDANSSYEEWQHRKSLHMSPVADSKSSGIFLSPVAAQSKEQSTAEFIRKRSFPQHPRPSPFGLVEKHHFKVRTRFVLKIARNRDQAEAQRHS